MKRRIVISAVVVLLVLIVSAAALIAIHVPAGEEKQAKKPFYVGVTYGGNATFTGGNATAEAKLLIDRVKNYTNLFVLQSGTLQLDLNETKEICDYAVASGLNVILYFSAWNSSQQMFQPFIDTARQDWGTHFLGVYYGDEPGGKMLDANYVELHDGGMGEEVYRRLPVVDGLPISLTVAKSDGTTIDYSRGLFHMFGNYSTINVDYSNGTSISWANGGLIFPNRTSTVFAAASHSTFNGTMYDEYPNGTTIATNYVYYSNGTIMKSYTTYHSIHNGSNGSSLTSTNATEVTPEDAPQVGTYQEALALLPFKTYDETAARLVDHIQTVTEWLRNQSIPLFTSDYDLHWFDYLGGYDTVLTQLGGNRSVAQDIALVRGAANLQNKSWGAILTWKYDKEPYLGSGDEIYSQMRTAYEAGAEYVVVFNYPAITGNPYGILQDEHFRALERFWNEVVQNPQMANGGVKAEAALVLPRNYGWGMRNPNDTIWGMWPADNKSQQVWTLLQSNLATYGSYLDIVYDDPAYPVSGKYLQIYYWNQTS